VHADIPVPRNYGVRIPVIFILVEKYPAAASLKESDIADSSFMDELEQSGFIDRLYGADRK
jgi:hypothetical protein